MRPTVTETLLNELNALEGRSYPDIGYSYYADIKGDGTRQRRVYDIMNANGAVRLSRLNGETHKETLQKIRAAIRAKSPPGTSEEELRAALRRAHCSKTHPIEVNGKQYIRRINNVVFRALTEEERFAENERRADLQALNGVVDDRACSCRYCSKDRTPVKSVKGVWDTEALDLITGKTWTVHFPELQGVKSKRAFA